MVNKKLLAVRGGHVLNWVHRARRVQVSGWIGTLALGTGCVAPRIETQPMNRSVVGEIAVLRVETAGADVTKSKIFHHVVTGTLSGIHPNGQAKKLAGRLPVVPEVVSPNQWEQGCKIGADFGTFGLAATNPQLKVKYSKPDGTVYVGIKMPLTAGGKRVYVFTIKFKKGRVPEIKREEKAFDSRGNAKVKEIIPPVSKVLPVASQSISCSGGSSGKKSVDTSLVDQTADTAAMIDVGVSQSGTESDRGSLRDTTDRNPNHVQEMGSMADDVMTIVSDPSPREEILEEVDSVFFNTGQEALPNDSTVEDRSELLGVQSSSLSTSPASSTTMLNSPNARIQREHSTSPSYSMAFCSSPGKTNTSCGDGSCCDADEAHRVASPLAGEIPNFLSPSSKASRPAKSTSVGRSRAAEKNLGKKRPINPSTAFECNEQDVEQNNMVSGVRRASSSCPETVHRGVRSGSSFCAEASFAEPKGNVIGNGNGLFLFTNDRVSPQATSGLPPERTQRGEFSSPSQSSAVGQSVSEALKGRVMQLHTAKNSLSRESVELRHKAAKKDSDWPESFDSRNPQNNSENFKVYAPHSAGAVAAPKSSVSRIKTKYEGERVEEQAKGQTGSVTIQPTQLAWGEVLHWKPQGRGYSVCLPFNLRGIDLVKSRILQWKDGQTFKLQAVKYANGNRGYVAGELQGKPDLSLLIDAKQSKKGSHLSTFLCPESNGLQLYTKEQATAPVYIGIRLVALKDESTRAARFTLKP